MGVQLRLRVVVEFNFQYFNVFPCNSVAGDQIIFNGLRSIRSRMKVVSAAE